MEQLIEIGILQQSDEQDNLYEKILARIAKSDVTSWMGWGPVDWVGGVHPEPKFENKWTLFFEFF